MTGPSTMPPMFATPLIKLVMKNKDCLHRKLLSVCLAVAGVSAGLTYTLMAGHLASLCLGLAITGAMLAPTWPASAAALASWFPDNQRNSVFGLIATATFSGGLGGTALAAALQGIYGWQYVGIPPST